MHMQAPTLTTTRRPPMFAVVLALAVAAAVVVVLALATNDQSTPAVAPVQPAVAQGAQDRILDGSPLLRATTSAPAVTISSQSGLDRVWDGSPALRGSSAHPHSGGGPSIRLASPTSALAGTTSAQPQAQFPVRPPEGFHRVP
jgi:hypothetical protein